MKKYKFGNLDDIKEIKDDAAKRWIERNLEDIMEELDINHEGEHVCSECGQSTGEDCGGSLQITLRNVFDKQLSFSVFCYDCDFDFDATVRNWKKIEYVVEEGLNKYGVPEHPNQMKLFNE